MAKTPWYRGTAELISDVLAVFPKNMKLAADLFQREDVIVLIDSGDQTTALAASPLLQFVSSNAAGK